MNILLMGLESRTDYDGNVLPANLLAAMHAGSVQGVEFDGVGGQDTNTLILIHIFAGGQKAVGFSIPRDDWVTFPQAYDGQSQGKIDQAYGLAYAQSLNETVNSSMSRNQRYLAANEAGSGCRDRHGEDGDRPAGRPLRRGEPGRVLRAGAGLRRHRSLREAVGRRQEPARRQLRRQPQGGLSAPRGRAGAGVRPGAGQPPERRPGPHSPPAGGPRLRDMETQAPGCAHQLQPAHQAC